jgi:hypothetical protein
MIDQILSLRPGAIPYRFGKYLAEAHPALCLLETAGGLDVHGYADAGLCTLAAEPGYQQWVAGMRDDAVVYAPAVYAGTVTWQGHAILVHVLRYAGDEPPRVYVLGPSDAIVEEFFAAVSRWSSELRDQILVFEGGCFEKDEALYAAIKSATFDNLVLADALADTIKADMDGFFASRELYARYRIPWKRGILFTGPPGNGKTHAVKALLNRSRRNALYVKSFDVDRTFPQAGVAMVFERARATTPCIIVLEDLDSLIGPHNRSFFLNELDGFAANDGIVVLATTNHPERLDSAILERPSRFDRTYAFALPQAPERAAYIRMWNATLESSLVLSDETVLAAAEATDGFSFAYLRELFLSSLMRWVSDGAAGPFDPTVATQIETLRQQINAAGGDEPIAEGEAGLNGMGVPSRMMMRMMQGRMGGFNVTGSTRKR